MAAFLPLATILISLLAATATANNGYTTPPASTPPPQNGGGESKLLVRIEGLVYCQSCAHRNSWSLDGAKPLPKSKVAVTCRDAKNRVSGWRLAVADETGYFLAEFGVTKVVDFFMGDPRRACYVRLLASPDEECNELTNINFGIEGAPLRDEGKKWAGQGFDNVVYASGPLAFRPAKCAPRQYYH
uniref:Uncharacterized protein n=1 Tax=Leersia perrieri TaxID=77586 RepID=A0A0D9UX37_9ORYZ